MVVKHGAGSLVTGSDSPVRVDSSTSSPLASSTRASAPTTEPASRVITTAADQGLGRHRRGPATLEDGGQDLVRTRRARRTARSARKRWAAPNRALAPVTAPITAASAVDPTMADSAALPPAPGRGGWPARSPPPDRSWNGAETVRATGPRRARASRADSPARLVPSSASTSSGSSSCHGGRAGGTGLGRCESAQAARGAVADGEQGGHVHARERAATSGGTAGHREQRTGARSQQRHGRALPAHLVRHARGLDEKGRIRQAVEHHDVATPHRDVARENADAHVGGTERAPCCRGQRQHHTAIGLQPPDRVGQRRTTVDRQVGPDVGDQPRRTTCHGHHVLRLAGGVDQLDRTERELVRPPRTPPRGGRRGPGRTPRHPAAAASSHGAHRSRPEGRAARPDRPPTPAAASRGTPVPGRRGCARACAPRRGRSPRAARVAPPATR